MFKRGKKIPGIYRLATFILLPRKVMEQIFLETISKYMKDKKVISSQHGLSKGKMYRISLIAFCNEMTSSVGKTTVGFVDFEFSCTILIDKLVKYQLDKLIARLLSSGGLFCQVSHSHVQDHSLISYSRG